MPVSKMSISLLPKTAAEVKRRNRGNQSATVNSQLARYFEALRRERRGLRNILTENECALILDATNGVSHYPETVNMFAYGVLDAIELDDLDAKWGVDPSELMLKIQNAAYITYLTIIDGAERWWIRVAQGEQPPHTDLLAD